MTTLKKKKRHLNVVLTVGTALNIVTMFLLSTLSLDTLSVSCYLPTAVQPAREVQVL